MSYLQNIYTLHFFNRLGSHAILIEILSSETKVQLPVKRAFTKRICNALFNPNPTSQPLGMMVKTHLGSHAANPTAQHDQRVETRDGHTRFDLIKISINPLARYSHCAHFIYNTVTIAIRPYRLR